MCRWQRDAVGFDSLTQQVSLTGRSRVVYDTFISISATLYIHILLLIPPQIFGHELDMLEVHLHTLGPYVDYFVIAEGAKTFSNEDKPMYLCIFTTSTTKGAL